MGRSGLGRPVPGFGCWGRGWEERSPHSEQQHHCISFTLLQLPCGCCPLPSVQPVAILKRKTTDDTHVLRMKPSSLEVACMSGAPSAAPQPHSAVPSPRTPTLPVPLALGARPYHPHAPAPSPSNSRLLS